MGVFGSAVSVVRLSQDRTLGEQHASSAHDVGRSLLSSILSVCGVPQLSNPFSYKSKHLGRPWRELIGQLSLTLFSGFGEYRNKSIMHESEISK